VCVDVCVCGCVCVCVCECGLDVCGRRTKVRPRVRERERERGEVEQGERRTQGSVVIVIESPANEYKHNKKPHQIRAKRAPATPIEALKFRPKICKCVTHTSSLSFGGGTCSRIASKSGCSEPASADTTDTIQDTQTTRATGTHYK